MTVINMVGQPCPLPVIEAKKALRTAGAGESVSILVDNDLARQNLQKMAEGLGCQFAYETTAEGHILVTATPGAVCRPLAAETPELVVAIGRETMGSGDDDLGRTLMKSFIYALTELDTPPVHLLFFNGGVRLTTEGAATVDDLAALAAKGTAVSSCGACLNFYGLTEKLKVGSVTNMYAIVSAMGQAQKLINL